MAGFNFAARAQFVTPDGRLTAEALKALSLLAAEPIYATAAPTTGRHQTNELVRNSASAETGTAGNKHVVFGWLCVAGGTPGTWVPLQIPTDH